MDASKQMLCLTPSIYNTITRHIKTIKLAISDLHAIKMASRSKEQEFKILMEREKSNK